MGTVANERVVPETAAYRFGMLMFLVTQGVPFILIWAVAYAFDGFYVSPQLNQWVGGIEAVLLLLSGICASQGVSAIKNGDLPTLLGRFKTTIVLGVGDLAVTAYQWGTRFTPPGTRFGEIYYTLSGVSGFYTLVAVLGMAAITLRAARIQLTRHNYWDAEAIKYFWNFQVLTGLVTYIILYWL